MLDRMRIANAQKSKVRSAVEHVFAHQKGPMGVVRTIGIARANLKIGMANLGHGLNDKRPIASWHIVGRESHRCRYGAAETEAHEETHECQRCRGIGNSGSYREDAEDRYTATEHNFSTIPIAEGAGHHRAEQHADATQHNGQSEMGWRHFP